MEELTSGKHGDHCWVLKSEWTWSQGFIWNVKHFEAGWENLKCNNKDAPHCLKTLHFFKLVYFKTHFHFLIYKGLMENRFVADFMVLG